MEKEKDIKVNRILNIYSKLIKGEIINKKESAELFNVSEKAIQRDIEDIRSFFYENRTLLVNQDVVYKRSKNGYFLDSTGEVLTKEAILVLMKILLESRALCKDEISYISKALMGQVSLEQRKSIDKIIGNELFNYVPTQHSDYLLSKMWDISECIRGREVIEISYINMKNIEGTRKIRPVSIIFSEYYFYLIAYINDFESPTVFRIDRIKSFKKVKERFLIPESNRFEDGEFRKRIQFMYSGKLQKIKFEFWGSSIEAVLDRVPTAKIVDKYDNKYLVEAEVYGKGIIMWILSQGSKIKLLEPKEFVNELIEQIDCMKENYK